MTDILRRKLLFWGDLLGDPRNTEAWMAHMPDRMDEREFFLQQRGCPEMICLVQRLSSCEWWLVPVQCVYTRVRRQRGVYGGWRVWLNRVNCTNTAVVLRAVRCIENSWDEFGYRKTMDTERRMRSIYCERGNLRIAVTVKGKFRRIHWAM